MKTHTGTMVNLVEGDLRFNCKNPGRYQYKCKSAGNVENITKKAEETL